MARTCKKSALIIGILTALTIGSAGEGMAEQVRLEKKNSTLTDMASGLVWPVDADTPAYKQCEGGRKTWQEASDYVNCLNANKYLGYSDWRLPSPEELITLANVPAKDNKKVAWLKLKEHGFKIENPTFFWTSTAPTDEVAFAVDMLAGGKIRTMGRLSPLRVWPVRGGK